jgi:exonuclease VII small subunit
MASKLTYALIIITVIGAMAWGLVSYNNLLQTQSELDQLHRDIATLEMNLEIANNSLAQAQEDLTSAQQELSSVESELEQYKDTWGSVVSSDVQPPYQGADIANYETASNPTWARLLDFLRNDGTDAKAYVPGVYMCGDFARDLHNDAERAGIRAAYVAVEFSSGYHALDAFKTTDRGLVFIDCTGLEAWEPGPSNCDKTVDVRLGKRYVPKSLFPEPGWSWKSMGTVLDVQIYW